MVSDGSDKIKLTLEQCVNNGIDILSSQSSSVANRDLGFG
jgi:hypothetical protein